MRRGSTSYSRTCSGTTRPDELAVIKAKYATEGDVLEAPLLIEQKARDMIRHYVSVVLPERFQGAGRSH